jgi:hypothetical protein
MKVAQSVRVDTIQTLNAQRPASLYCLPVELIWDICQHLSIAGGFCLMISCARFWHWRYNTHPFNFIRNLLNRAANNNLDIIEARFRILRRIEFDNIYEKGIQSFFCWVCMCTHKKSTFYDRILANPINLKLSVTAQTIRRVQKMCQSWHDFLKKKFLFTNFLREYTSTRNIPYRYIYYYNSRVKFEA